MHALLSVACALASSLLAHCMRPLLASAFRAMAAAAAPRAVHIDIISDTVCPWCWVGACCAAQRRTQSAFTQAHRSRHCERDIASVR
jgi:hypothetical protein